MNWDRDKSLLQAMRLVLGCIFLYASLDKIRQPKEFAEAVYNYRILPDALVNVLAVVLPWIELIVGILLVAGFLVGGSLFICVFLMTVFLGAMAVTLIRGIDVQCGCFSLDAGEPITYLTLFRDSLILAFSAYVFRKYLKKSS